MKKIKLLKNEQTLLQFRSRGTILFKKWYKIQNTIYDLYDLYHRMRSLLRKFGVINK